jgi:hypothetical protein
LQQVTPAWLSYLHSPFWFFSIILTTIHYLFVCALSICPHKSGDLKNFIIIIIIKTTVVGIKVRGLYMLGKLSLIYTPLLRAGIFVNFVHCCIFNDQKRPWHNRYMINVYGLSGWMKFGNIWGYFKHDSTFWTVERFISKEPNRVL